MALVILVAIVALLLLLWIASFDEKGKKEEYISLACVLIIIAVLSLLSSDVLW